MGPAGPAVRPGRESLRIDAFNTPTVLRTPIGHLVACPDNACAYQAAADAGELLRLASPTGAWSSITPADSTLIPPNGTVVAVAAFVDGHASESIRLPETLRVDSRARSPVNEEDFFRDPTDTTGVPGALRPYIGRRCGRNPGQGPVLGHAGRQRRRPGLRLCHFHAGVDNRTKGQLNPNISWQAISPCRSSDPITDVVASRLSVPQAANPDVPSEDDPAMRQRLQRRHVLDGRQPIQDSSLTSRVGSASIHPAGTASQPCRRISAPSSPDPVAVNQGLRRVEPRNTPTMHGAAFNFDNFWDGRARFIYNGGSVFGPSDPTAHIFINDWRRPGACTAPPWAISGPICIVEESGNRRTAGQNQVLQPGFPVAGPAPQRLRDVVRRPQLGQDRQETAPGRRDAPGQPVGVYRRQPAGTFLQPGGGWQPGHRLQAGSRLPGV